MKIQIEIGGNLLNAIRHLLVNVEKWNRRVMSISNLLYPGKEIQKAFGINIKDIMEAGKGKNIKVLKEIEELDFEEEADGEDEETERKHKGHKRKE